MRYPTAIWRPTDKHGYPNAYTHLQNGVVIHSAEGSLAGALSVLDGPRQASWHFFITKMGEVYQHVDTDNIAWTNGSLDANRLFWGIECEGGGPGHDGEPLTEPQFEALLGVLRWLWETHDVAAFVRQETAWEHNEMTQFGSAPTACPSGRIPWERLIPSLTISPIEEEDVTKDEFNREFERACREVKFPTRDEDSGRATSANHTVAAYMDGFRKDTIKDRAHAEDAAKHSAGASHDHGLGRTSKS